MIKLIDFTTGFDRVIQMALRDIDMEDLSDAMPAWDEEEQEIIYRNMSKRAAGILKKEVKENEGQVSPIRIRAAQSFYLQKLQQHLRYYSRDNEEAKKLLAEIAERRSEGEAELPPVDLTSDEKLIESFIELSKFVKRNGVLSLSGIEDSIEHPFMKKALQYLIDGWDPILYQSIMERMSAEYVHKVKRQLDMITVGIESLAASDHPVGMEERLRAFMA
jgi:hypothetical protein